MDLFYKDVLSISFTPCVVLLPPEPQGFRLFLRAFAEPHTMWGLTCSSFCPFPWAQRTLRGLRELAVSSAVVSIWPCIRAYFSFSFVVRPLRRVWALFLQNTPPEPRTARSRRGVQMLMGSRPLLELTECFLVRRLLVGGWTQVPDVMYESSEQVDLTVELRYFLCAENFKLGIGKTEF